jgi:aromatic ring hydroxylase
MNARPEDVVKNKGRPFTGVEYLESLRDGREIWIHGERVGCHQTSGLPKLRRIAG